MTFTPVAGFAGTPSTPIQYAVTDSLGQKASSTYTPTVQQPGAPTAAPERKPVIGAQPVTFTAIVGSGGLASGTGLKTGVAGGPAFVCPVTGASACSATSVSVTNQGVWTINQTTGIVTFTPVAGLTTAGDLTAVSYRVTDEAGQTATASLTPFVVPPPVSSSDASIGEQGKKQTMSPLGNDSVGSVSSPFVPQSLKLCAVGSSSPCSLTSLSVPGEGSYTVNPDGTVDFVPEAGFVGTATSVVYDVVDLFGQRTSTMLTATVAPPPFPSASPDSGSAPVGSPVVFEPWRNDAPGTPPAGSISPAPRLVPTSIRLCAPGESVPSCTATTLTTPDGTYVVDVATGKVTFAGAVGFTGAATQPVVYQVSNDWSGLAGPGVTSSVLIPRIDSQASADQSSPSTTPTPLPRTGDGALSDLLARMSLFVVVSGLMVLRVTRSRLLVR